MTQYDGANNPNTTPCTAQATSNTAPSPQVCSATSENGNYRAWKAFNQNNNYSDSWRASSVAPGAIMVDLGSGHERLVNKYKVCEGYDGGDDFKDFKFQGSNDVTCSVNDAGNSSKWTTLDTRTGITSWNNTFYTFSCDTAYRYFRFYITAVKSSGYAPATSEIILVAQDVPITVAAVAGSVETSGSASGIQVWLPPVAGEVSFVGFCPYAGWQGFVQSVPVFMDLQAGIAGIVFIIIPESGQLQAETTAGQVGLVRLLAATPGEISIAESIAGLLFYCRPQSAQVQTLPEYLLIRFSLKLLPAVMDIVPVATVRRFAVNTPVVTYRCVLTGAADGLPDVVIPISSFQIRKRAL